MTTSPYQWHRQTVAETFERICGRNSATPWVAIGDFLDDWRRSAVEHRRELVTEPIAPAPTPDLHKWAAFCAAMVEWLCWQDGLPFPEWTMICTSCGLSGTGEPIWLVACSSSWGVFDSIIISCLPCQSHHLLLLTVRGLDVQHERRKARLTISATTRTPLV